MYGLFVVLLSLVLCCLVCLAVKYKYCCLMCLVICFSASVFYLCCVVLCLMFMWYVWCFVYLCWCLVLCIVAGWVAVSGGGLQTRLQTLHSLQHCSTAALQHRVIITSAADLITTICTAVWYNIHQPPAWILLTTNCTNEQQALSNVSPYILNCSNSAPCCPYIHFHGPSEPGI